MSPHGEESWQPGTQRYSTLLFLPIEDSSWLYHCSTFDHTFLVKALGIHQNIYRNLLLDPYDDYDEDKYDSGAGGGSQIATLST